MNKHNQKHLTISDRLYIEQELLQETTFKAIANVLHKDPTTISKEIKRARILIPRDRFTRKCYRWNPQDECPNFLEFTCNRCTKAPYVCNSCPKQRSCFLEHYIYDAKKAHHLYEQSILQACKKGGPIL